MSDNPLLQSLKELCLFLNDSGMDYMLIGGLAVGVWAEPRATIDIDFVVSAGAGDFSAFQQRVRESEKFIFIHDNPMTFGKITLLRATLKSNVDVSADFLYADDDFKKGALQRKVVVPFMGFSVNIVTPEDLILLKRLSGRRQDQLDAEKIFEARRESLDHAYIRKWSEKMGMS